jgi:protein-disulfide isomerase
MGIVTALILPLLIFGHAFAQPLTKEEIVTRIAKDGPAKGIEKAPLTLVEFSDFQCSFCRKFWEQTLPKIEEKYIDKGRVRFVYRHFAILGKPSVAAAQASECAHEQGRFWAYHDKLFESADSPLAFTNSKLKSYARELGLEGRVFDRCLDSERYKESVDGMTAVGAFLGARGTPTFFLNGRLLVGAQPIEVFDAAIEAESKRLSAAKKPPAR